MAERRESRCDVFWTSKRKLFLFMGLLLVLLGLAVYWQTGWSGSFQELPARLDDFRFKARTLPMVVVVLAIMLASVLAMPLGIIIISGSVVFGPWLGGLYVVIGALFGAMLSFLIGVFLGRQVVEDICGPRLQRVSISLGRRGLLSVIIIRLLPIAPFAIVNMFAGATHIRFRDFVLGSFIGMLPGVVILGVGIEQFLTVVMG